MAKTHTSTEVKNRFNKKTYKTEIFKVRKDSELAVKIAEYKKANPMKFGSLVKDLLMIYFGIKEN